MSFHRRLSVHSLLLLTKLISLKPDTGPGSKCCQKMESQGAKAREYLSFPSSCWNEMFWWEAHMEIKVYLRVQFRNTVKHSRKVKARTWGRQLCAVPGNARMDAWQPVLSSHSPVFCHQDTGPKNWAACSGMSLCSSWINLMKTSTFRNSQKPHN